MSRSGTLGPIFKVTEKSDSHWPNARCSQERKTQAEVQRGLRGFRKELAARARHAPVGMRDRLFYLFGQKHRLAQLPDR